MAETKVARTFRATIVRDGSMCYIPVTFDPKPVFGKVKAPVKVTLNGYTYASTIASMGAGPCLPLRRSHREAAGLEGGETLAITLTLDTGKREVKPPPDFVKALNIDHALDGEVMLAWQMNGADLPFLNGYPCLLYTSPSPRDS